MKDLKYTEILKRNKRLEKELECDYQVAVLSNCTVNLSKEIFELGLREEKVGATISIGEYDNIVQDSFRFQDKKAIIIFWELGNVIDGLSYKMSQFDQRHFDEIYNKVKQEIDLILKNLQSIPLILFNLFSAWPFSLSNSDDVFFAKLADQLNQYLLNLDEENLRLIDLEKVLFKVGLDKAVNWRNYYSSKALYTIDFYKEYLQFIKPYCLCVQGKTKKVLVFDCDNTLWSGVLGEEGFDGIEMSSDTNNGAIFSEVQHLAYRLHKQGTLLCLCSKNNNDDVEQVLQKHPHMIINNDCLVIKKINWNNKVTNLKEIAEELNVGLDSLIFVDDSEFEVNLVMEQLPEIYTVQVPKKLYEYPSMIREISKLLYNNQVTEEDLEKTKFYKEQTYRKLSESSFTDIKDYLSSLQMQIQILSNDKTVIPRMSQMSQKTNQFNLTTKRYAESDIKQFVEGLESDILAFSVSDKFGDNGLCGLCVLKLDQDSSEGEIDTLLMSCRIIGRNLEFSFMDYLIRFLKKKNIKFVRAKYMKTLKNQQVENFYEQCSFALIEQNENEKIYQLNISEYILQSIDYIELHNG